MAILCEAGCAIICTGATIGFLACMAAYSGGCATITTPAAKVCEIISIHHLIECIKE
jgi:hypothetical protein